MSSTHLCHIRELLILFGTLLFQSDSVAELFWIPDGARLWFQEVQRDTSATQEDRYLLRMRADFSEWLSYSVEDGVAELRVFSQQAAASCFLPSLRSTSPHHSPAPTQSDTAPIKRHVTPNQTWYTERGGDTWQHVALNTRTTEHRRSNIRRTLSSRGRRGGRLGASMLTL